MPRLIKTVDRYQTSLLPFGHEEHLYLRNAKGIVVTQTLEIELIGDPPRIMYDFYFTNPKQETDYIIRYGRSPEPMLVEQEVGYKEWLRYMFTEILSSLTARVFRGTGRGS